MASEFVFTSQSVTAGHPDKICDRISDAIVDRFLLTDPLCRVAAECAVAKGVAFIATRFAAENSVDVASVARRVIEESGYTGSDFNARDCSVLTSLVEMPASLRQPVDERQLEDRELDRLTALNQITAFGYACRQTPELMPLPIVLAHDLAGALAEARKSGLATQLTPDATTQVGVAYADREPRRVHSITVVVSQRQPDAMDLKTLRALVTEKVIEPVFARRDIRPDDSSRVFVNPNGLIIGGGPATHSGMTGRKTGVDTYGGFARQSESAMSGKDPLRVDRVACYAARYAAKNIVAAGLAEECEVQLSYSVGMAAPVSVNLDTFGTAVMKPARIRQRLGDCLDLRVGAVIARFALRELPARHDGHFYRRLSAYGQLGRSEPECPWELTDLAGELA